MIRNISTGSIIFVVCLLTSVGLAQDDSLKVKDPKIAGYYGLMHPGAGQLYNGKYFKAGLIVTLEIISYMQFQKNAENYRNYDNLNLGLRRTRYLEKRNKYAWWMGFIYIYGVLDAIVDAHLYKFDEIMDENLEGAENKEKGTL